MVRISAAQISRGSDRAVGALAVDRGIDARDQFAVLARRPGAKSMGRAALHDLGDPCALLGASAGRKARALPCTRTCLTEQRNGPLHKLEKVTCHEIWPAKNWWLDEGPRKSAACAGGIAPSRRAKEVR